MSATPQLLADEQADGSKDESTDPTCNYTGCGELVTNDPSGWYCDRHVEERQQARWESRFERGE